MRPPSLCNAREEEVGVEFSEVISSWETYYLLVGTAAVTLIGLLFVAITINIDTFRRRTGTDVQLFGVLTFNSFFYVLETISKPI